MFFQKKHLLVASLAFLLFGCSDQQKAPTAADKKEPIKQENKKETKTTESKQFDLERKYEFPKNYLELANLSIGEYAGKEMKEEDPKWIEQLKKLPKITSKLSNEELDTYYLNILSYVQEPFTSPQTIMNQLTFAAYGDPKLVDQRFHFKEQFNVEILLDASGSMAESINGTTKMELAKKSIQQFVKQLPKEAKVGLRVYGHKGSGSDVDKQLSCTKSELVYGLKSYEEASFQKALNQFQPAGWTSIALAMKEAQKDLAKYDSSKNTNVIYLVSDGIETCDGDPVTAAKQLYESNISPIINVIGFDVNSEGQTQLRSIAKETKGFYSDVRSQDQLVQELNKVKDMAKKWEEWKKKSSVKLELQYFEKDKIIFSYSNKEITKSQRESDSIIAGLRALRDSGHISSDAFGYLSKKNTDYHKWIWNEIHTVKKDLETINESNFHEALKDLEERYKSIAQP